MLGCLHRENQDVCPLVAVCLLLCIKQSQSGEFFPGFIPQVTILLQRITTYKQKIHSSTGIRIVKIFFYIFHFVRKMHAQQQDEQRVETPIASELLAPEFIK